MKKFKFLLGLILLTLVFTSCEKESVNQDEFNQKIFEESVKPDFREILLGDKTSKVGLPPDIIIRTASDYISTISPGCYEVNVRVYMSYEGGQEFLVANDNVQIGDCGTNKMSATNKGSDCSGYLPDGNLVVENNTDDDICLYELLMGNEESYNQYLDEINQY